MTNSEPKRRLTYTVAGCWPFPTDMLRHDDARPATAADRAMVKRLSGLHAPDREAFQTVQIKLVMEGDWFKGRRPNSARWKSFTWTVVDDPWAAWDAEQRRISNVRDSALRKLTKEEREALGLNKLAA